MTRCAFDAMLGTMKILLHICCAPCSIVSIDRLREEGHELHGFWYNPNVQPWTENEKRRTAVETYSSRVNLPVIWRNEYRLQEFLRMVAFRETERCRLCFRMRLAAAANVAKRGKFDAFTTSLLYSKTQPHELLIEVAEAVGKEAGVPFLYRDFRPGWQEGIARSKQEGLYRQQYCGCIYSEKDRYIGGKTG